MLDLELTTFDVVDPISADFLCEYCFPKCTIAPSGTRLQRILPEADLISFKCLPAEKVCEYLRLRAIGPIETEGSGCNRAFGL